MRWTHAFMYGRSAARDRTFDGRFFMAVTTTGIFCLPSCPARKPKAGHARFFETEAAAREAGFRPCLRCRPERFRAGEDGDLDGVERLIATVRKEPAAFRTAADLASASGMGATALAERFREHLHATPAAFLLAVRIREAERLLLETALPASQVALEAGFESLSAFHAQFRKRSALTPGKYRELARGDSFVLSLPADFRARDMLAYHGRDPLSLCERVEGSTLFKAVGGRVLEIRFQGREAHCRVHGGASSPAEFHPRALRMLGLRQDPTPFERTAAKDRAFGALAAQRPGLRIPLTADVWESLVWAILGQQVNLAFAYSLRRALVERCGETSVLGLRGHPGPEALARLAPEDLAGLRLSRAKAECLLRVAQSAAAGDLDLEALPEGAASRASARLRAIKGIGPWTAQYVLMRGCGFADCVPVGDAGLTLALQRHLGLDHRPGPSETEALLAPFAPHRSLAVFHLWASLTGEPT